jgi:uncharacterized coiled-coil DUF342 family protein|tara:strand:+ start:376 stop:807 length:432 start_codon:yes stop_codon:yes gene_type:complete
MDINFNKKAKSELDRITLKAQKVEFAVIDEVNKFLDRFAKLTDEAFKLEDEAYTPIAIIEKEANKARKYKNQMSGMAKELRASQDSVEDEINKAKKMAKELGIDFSALKIDYSKYNKAIQNADDFAFFSDKFLKIVNNLPNIN